MCSARPPDPQPLRARPLHRAPRAGDDPGQAPASALLRGAARRLESCLATWDGAGHALRLAHALHHHQQLWVSLEGELGRSHAGLPPEFLQDLSRLARFIEVWTSEVLTNPEPTRLRAMVDIDRGMATILSSLAEEPRVGPSGTQEAT